MTSPLKDLDGLTRRAGRTPACTSCTKLPQRGPKWSAHLRAPSGIRVALFRFPAFRVAAVMAVMLIGTACCDAADQSAQRLVGPANQALSHQDSVQRGYFELRAPAAPVAAAACDVDCPVLVSADPPSLFQGYTQPGPVTLTFAGDAGSVTVSGRGAIQCGSGQYGTIIGYDADGVELGRADLQLIDPSDCSPPSNPDDVTFGARATLETPRPMAQAVILPMSPLQFLVLGECCGYASATYTVTVDKGILTEIHLACSGPVPRGEVISCTASPEDPDDTLVVTGWTYRSVNDRFVDRQSNVDSLTWQGQLAVDGQITVAGTVNGVAGQSVPVNVNVTARDWSDKTAVKKDHQIDPQDTLPSRPANIHQLGYTKMQLPLDFANQSEWLSIIDDDGPNAGFAYLLDLPAIAYTRPRVNNNALNDTSGFYRIQEPVQTKRGNTIYCGQSFVLGIIPLAEAHEGYDPDNQPNSHAGIFRRHVDSLAAKVFEPAAGPADGDAIDAPRLALFDEAAADSHRMDSDSRNNLNSQTVPCTFKYDYRKLDK